MWSHGDIWTPKSKVQVDICAKWKEISSRALEILRFTRMDENDIRTTQKTKCLLRQADHLHGRSELHRQPSSSSLHSGNDTEMLQKPLPETEGSRVAIETTEPTKKPRNSEKVQTKGCRNTHPCDTHTNSNRFLDIDRNTPPQTNTRYTSVLLCSVIPWSRVPRCGDAASQLASHLLFKAQHCPIQAFDLIFCNIYLALLTDFLSQLHMLYHFISFIPDDFPHWPIFLTTNTTWPCYQIITHHSIVKKEKKRTITVVPQRLDFDICWHHVCLMLRLQSLCRLDPSLWYKWSTLVSKSAKWSTRLAWWKKPGEPSYYVVVRWLQTGLCVELLLIGATVL